MLEPKSWIMDIEKYNPCLEGRGNKICMDFNENQLGCSDKVISALRKIKKTDISKYPCYDRFISNLAGKIGVSENQLILTNGSDEAIKLVMDTYVSPNDEVIIPKPAFDIFELYAKSNGARVISIPYENFVFPCNKIIETITNKTKAVVIINPNNPTGTVVGRDEIIEILESKRDCVVVLDEAYFRFYGRSNVDLIDRYDNLIVIRTFSKDYGLAGLRLGYLVTRKENVNAIRKIIAPYNVNSLAVILGSVALEDEKFLDKYVRTVKNSMRFVCEEMFKLGINTFKSDTNFLLIDFKQSTSFVIGKLKGYGILVREKYGLLRITLGLNWQMRKFISAVREIISKPVLIFDLDGVLVDVKNSYYKAIKETVFYLTGKRITNKVIDKLKLIGYNNDWVLTRKIVEDTLCRRVSLKRISGIFQSYYCNEGYKENEKWLLNEEILDNLSEEYQLAIFTGRPRDEATYIIEKNQSKFNSIICLEDVEDKGKPDPYGLKLVMDNLVAKNAVYFGDNIDDYLCAKSFGCKFVGVGELKFSKYSGYLGNISEINQVFEALK